jgi:copper(I)-binding protein
VSAVVTGGASGTRAWLHDLVRSAAGPVISAAVLIGLLSAWVAGGGAGSIVRVRIQVILAAVPMRGYTAAADSAAKTAPAYLTIRNLSGTPDELTSVTSPDASRVVLTRDAARTATGPAVAGLVIPAHGTLTLSPLGADAVLVDPASFESEGSVPLTLTFRHAGQVTVTAMVTPPGTP